MKRGEKQKPEALAKMRAAKLGKKMSEETKERMRQAQLRPETLEKNRAAHTGRIASIDTRVKMSVSHIGERNHFFGKHHTNETKMLLTGRPVSDESKVKMSEVKKGIIPKNIDAFKHSRLGVPTSDEHKAKLAIANTGLVRSDETKQKISENRTGLYCGAENHAWNGGTSFFPYCPKFNERRKKAVRKFFSDLCLTCSKPAAKNLRGEKAVALSVHHVHHNKTEGCHGVPFNLVPLCHDCHNEEQFDQEGYKLRINKILDEGFASGRWSREQYEREVMYPEESNET